MTTDVTKFYDDLATAYNYIFPDWKASVLRQANALDNLIRKYTDGPPLHLLDCTCGIGTQALGLATRGYAVHGTDLSPNAIEQAINNMPMFDLPLTPTFAVADLLNPEPALTQYGVVIACDNAVAHFLDDDSLARAVDTMVAQVKPGGVLLISLRDYDALVQVKPTTTPVSVSRRDGGQNIFFQVWDWAEDGRSYDVQMFSLQERDGQWQTTCHLTHLRALQRQELKKVLAAAGLTDIEWHMPETSTFYQPIVSAIKPQ